jgi:hypothetical protein
MNRNGILLLLLFIAIISLSFSCTPEFLRPERDLWGHWRNVNNQAGILSFIGDLYFREDGQLILLGSPIFGDEHYSYVVIAPGQLKLTLDEKSEIIQYVLNEDELILMMDGEQVQYERMMIKNPTTEDLGQISNTPSFTKTPTEALPSHTQPALTLTNTETAILIEPINTPTLLTPTVENTRYITPTPERYFPLTNCAASQLRLGDSAYVDYEGGRNSLRDTPDTHPSDNIIGYIYPGEVVEIVDGPVCNYGWVLWEVLTTRYEIGWTPETNGVDFWLLPLTSRPICSGTLPTRLVEGEKAFVMEEFDLSNFIRETPKIGSHIISRIQPGGKMLVLEGPVCADGSNWWKVQAETTNVIGWTRENDAGRYFLAPIP